MHRASNSVVPTDILTTKQCVEAYLKPLTGVPDCGCPGCAMYSPTGTGSAPTCPGPHLQHCGTSAFNDPCPSYKCCQRVSEGSKRGYCQGCLGTGLSVVEKCKGGQVPAMY